jgi:hypothetical protein
MRASENSYYETFVDSALGRSKRARSTPEDEKRRRSDEYYTLDHSRTKAYSPIPANRPEAPYIVGV